MLLVQSIRDWNNRKSGDHPNNTIIEIGQNTERSLEDLRRHALTQTPAKGHQLTLMWKTLKRSLSRIPWKTGEWKWQQEEKVWLRWKSREGSSRKICYHHYYLQLRWCVFLRKCTAGHKLHKLQEKNQLTYVYGRHQTLCKKWKRIWNPNSGRDGIQWLLKDRIWHRKMSLAHNEKRKTINDRRNKITKSRTLGEKET